MTIGSLAKLRIHWHTTLQGIPYPPSVNRYWRNMRGRMVISAEGREYQRKIALTAPGTPRTERLAVEIDVFPPDLRERDLDNILKALLDAFQAAGHYEKDEQIDRLVIERKEVGRDRFNDKGSLTVRIGNILD